ncbi:MAG: helix-turn-helix domain-containing protein [Hyphomicrobiales bacterium]|nr:MAG: helix-turn-helix domain-containing protein [Hyphomicrobiales bacterium]
MTDGAVQDGADQQAAVSAGVTAGALLRQARLASGVHIATLAAALKVPVYKLEALEGDRLDVFPDAIFVRALASSICRTLKIDAAPVLGLLPHGASPRLPADRGINAAFKDSSSKKSKGSAMGGTTSGSRWVPMVVVLLLLAAVALVFMPRGVGFWSMSGITQVEPQAAGSDAHPTVGLVQEPPVVVDVPAPTQSPAASVSLVAPTPPAAAAVTEPKALPPQPQVSASTASSDAAAALVVKARGETWVQIRSISGGHSAQRVLQAGDSLVGPGPAPWAVVIGKAAVTEVLVRGEPLNLSTIARENVARFEVK